jgi:hypothetical protein
MRLFLSVIRIETTFVLRAAQVRLCGEMRRTPLLGTIGLSLITFANAAKLSSNYLILFSGGGRSLCRTRLSNKIPC